MSCERYQTLWAGDDPLARDEAVRHASHCPSCAEQREFDRALAGRIEAWKESAPEPPERLRRSIAALAPPPAARFGFRREPVAPSRRPTLPVWAGVAAAVVLGVTILLHAFPPSAPASPLEAAIEEVEIRQRDYARAIAGLEARAQPLLDRAADPAVDPERAALLLAYRDRLSHLDSVIAEVREFLEEHPGHAGGHTVLLAAYEEKDQVLRALLRLQPGESS